LQYNSYIVCLPHTTTHQAANRVRGQRRVPGGLGPSALVTKQQQAVAKARNAIQAARLKMAQEVRERRHMMASQFKHFLVQTEITDAFKQIVSEVLMLREEFSGADESVFQYAARRLSEMDEQRLLHHQKLQKAEEKKSRKRGTTKKKANPNAQQPNTARLAVRPGRTNLFPRSSEEEKKKGRGKKGKRRVAGQEPVEEPFSLPPATTKRNNKSAPNGAQSARRPANSKKTSSRISSRHNPGSAPKKHGLSAFDSESEEEEDMNEWQQQQRERPKPVAKTRGGRIASTRDSLYSKILRDASSKPSSRKPAAQKPAAASRKKNTGGPVQRRREQLEPELVYGYEEELSPQPPVRRGVPSQVSVQRASRQAAVPSRRAAPRQQQQQQRSHRRSPQPNKQPQRRARPSASQQQQPSSSSRRQPAPATRKPAPVTRKPAPVTRKPAPAARKPAPAARQPPRRAAREPEYEEQHPSDQFSSEVSHDPTAPDASAYGFGFANHHTEHHDPMEGDGDEGQESMLYFNDQEPQPEDPLDVVYEAVKMPDLPEINFDAMLFDSQDDGEVQLHDTDHEESYENAAGAE
jgi:hypothetical protein